MLGVRHGQHPAALQAPQCPSDNVDRKSEIVRHVLRRHAEPITDAIGSFGVIEDFENKIGDALIGGKALDSKLVAVSRSQVCANGGRYGCAHVRTLSVGLVNRLGRKGDYRTGGDGFYRKSVNALDSQPDDIPGASQPPNMTTPVGCYSHAPQQAGCDRDNCL
jgi:hypothetical protein